MKLRRILRDGEWLQSNCDKLGEMVFRRRLNRLKKRLEDLLNWPNPYDVLQEIIRNFKRQQPRILTFVEHPGAPCHNNYGEFLIRIGVLKRKISGSSVSVQRGRCICDSTVYSCNLQITWKLVSQIYERGFATLYKKRQANVAEYIFNIHR